MLYYCYKLKIKKNHVCEFLIFLRMIAIRTTYGALFIKCLSYLNKKTTFLST